MKKYFILFILCYALPLFAYEVETQEEALAAQARGKKVTILHISERSGCHRVSKDPIMFIDERIAQLKDLEALYINSCFTSKPIQLPKELFEMVQLKELMIYGPKLESLPKEIGNLVNLHRLKITNNGLSELPESIGRLMNLEILNLQFNQLTTLPNSIVNLVNLKEISAGSNPLERKNYGFGYDSTDFFSYKEFWEFYAMDAFGSNPPKIIPEAYIVTAKRGLSVRRKPNLKAKKVGTMPHKLKIAVYEKSKNVETIDGISAPWMRIKAVANSQYVEGWAWGGYLEKFVYTDKTDLVNKVYRISFQ